MDPKISIFRDMTVYAVLRSGDGRIKSITDPDGRELPPTEATLKQIMEEHGDSS